MRRQTLLLLIACGAILLASASVARSRDLDPPVPPSPDAASREGFIPETVGIVIPEAPRFADGQAEVIHPGFPIGAPCCSMIDTPPTPVPYPSVELWEGYCNHQDGLTDACCGCPPCVWVEIDALWLERDVGSDVVLVEEDGDDDAVLSSSDFDFDDEAGVRIAFGRLVGCTPVEFVYFGTHDWSSTIGAEDDDELNLPIGAFDNGAFTEADDVDARYASELDSFELNALKYECCRDITILGGVRFIGLDERFEIEAEDEDDGEGEFRIDVDNYLLGVQGGGAFERTCGRWTLGAVAKAGVYLNSSEARYSFLEEDDDDEEEDDETQDDDAASFVGEVMLGASYCLGAGFSLRGGYQLTWINGIVLAPDQFGNDEAGDEEFEPLKLDSDGDVLYDGAYLGLHWTR